MDSKFGATDLKYLRLIIIGVFVVNLVLNIRLLLNFIIGDSGDRVDGVGAVTVLGIVLCAFSILGCIEVKNKLSKFYKREYSRRIIFYLIVSILLLIGGIIEANIIKEGVMIKSGVVLASSCMVLYFINKNIWISMLEGNKHLNIKGKWSYMDEEFKVSPSWRLPWLFPLVKIESTSPKFNGYSIMAIFLALSTGVTALIVISFILVSLSFIECIFGLYTYIDGVCTNIVHQQGNGSNIYIVTVTDFKRKREYKFNYGSRRPFYDIGSKTFVVMGLFSRRYIEDYKLKKKK